MAVSRVLALNSPPMPQSPAFLEIPFNWEYNYDRMEVLAEIRVLPDSTSFLESIKDDKIELFDLLHRQILQMSFRPMIQDSLAVESVMDLRFRISRATSGPATEMVYPIDKEYLDQWIKNDFAMYDVSKPFVDNIDQGSTSELGIYRHGYHLIARYDPVTRIQKAGFSQPSTVFGNGLYYGYYDSFSNPVIMGSRINFASPVYEQAVPISDVQASLGDYEFKYARVAMRKNHMFDIKDLYYSFDVLVQNGYWTQLMSDQTSYQQHIRIPIGNTNLRLLYENYEQNIAMTQLHPVYWQNVNYMIDHRLNQFCIIMDNPWILFAYRRRSEKAKSTRFATGLESRADQFLLEKNFEIKLDPNRKSLISVKLEKSIIDDNFKPVEKGYQDRAQVDIDVGLMNTDLKISSSLTDFENLDSIVNLSQVFGFGRIGINSHTFLCKDRTFDVTPSIYSASDTLRTIKYILPASNSIYYADKDRYGFSYRVSAGIKRIENHIPYLSEQEWKNFRIERDIAFSGIDAQYHRSIGDYGFDLRQSMLWHAFDEDLRELPQFSYDTYARITRYLPHNNTLFAGLGVIGHSSYAVLNSSNTIIDNSAIVDLWTGFTITDRFELTVSFKNLLDGTIYGVYPIPQSIHVAVRWYYLN